MSKSERAELYKIKKHRDLSFLLQLTEQNHTQNIKKYVLKDGIGPKMADVKIPISVYFSFDKYDYAGKFLVRVENKSFCVPFVPKQNQHEENNLFVGVMSMKANQKAWLNVELYQKDVNKCAGYNGFNYEVTLQRCVYKNDNNFESKKLIYEENRQKAKELFVKKNYKEALKIYKNSINILSGLSKKFFSPDQIKELNQYCEKSQNNYLKCLAKMNGFGGRYDKQIGKLAKQIVEKSMRKYPQSLNSFYQKAIWLKYQSKFSDAEQSIKQALKKKFSDDEQTANMERLALKNMKDEIKKSKERNIRHLRRQEIRKKKAERTNQNIWDSDDQESQN